MGMLRRLPDVTRQVFNLFVMSDGTSKWHLSNARKMLKEMVLKLQKAEEDRMWAANE